MNYNLIKIENQDDPLNQASDNFISTKNMPDYSSSHWQKIIDSTYAYNTARFCVIGEDNQIHGTSLIYYCPKTGKAFTPRFGLCADNQDVFNILAKAIKDFSTEHQFKDVLITSGHDIFQSEKPHWHKKNIFIPLEYETHEKLWDAVPKKTKNMVRKAEKNGITIRISHNALESFYPLYQSHMLSKQLKIKPRMYFEKLQNEMKEKLVYVEARHNGEIAGYMIFLNNAHNASYLYNVCEHSAARDGANNLMMWNAFCYFYEQNKKFIELGESSENSPVYNFKKRLTKEPRIEDIFYVQLLQSQQRSLSEKIIGKLHAFQMKVLPYMPEAMQTHILLKEDSIGRVI